MADGTRVGQEISDVFRGTAGTDAPKDKGTGKGIEAKTIPAFVAGEALADLADSDPRIVVLTADLAHANRTVDFAARHPDRFFNIGVAEQNMVSIAAGMASTGLVPYAATFAAYLALLACEQLRTDCAYTGMPVRLLAHHSGMSLGYYGTSHHALEDIAVTRAIADLTVVCAADANQLRAILRRSLHRPGAMYIRLGRGRDPEVYGEVPEDLRIGKAIRLREGADLTIVATGSEVRACLDAAESLAADGIDARIVDMHTVDPLDRDEILAAANDTGALLTVEEHNVTGGLGSAVAETLAEAGAGVTFRRHGVPDEHVVIGPPAALYSRYRLDAAGVASVARELIGAKRERHHG
ncbi:MAG: transketolase family protein [Gaiellaceae bacterium]